MHKLNPVRRRHKPRYPRLSQVLSNPALLTRLPERWKRCSMAAASAGLLASISLSLSACRPDITANAGVPLPPESLSENDAMDMIKNSAGELFTGMRKSYRIAESSKSITYVSFDVSLKALGQVNLIKDGDDLEIDAFSPEQGIGFEYIEKNNDLAGEPTGFKQTGNTIEHAEKDSGYVLVLPTAYDDVQQANSQIRQQVEAFISWLKAEGVI
jgi:hypothetical protein